MKRSEFVAVAAAATLLPLAAPASTEPALRVLLGSGDATLLAAGGFEFEGRAYRGTFSRLPDGSIVNAVGLEEYLYSVVPREMPSLWPAAALQMQAICARSFVLQRADPQRAYDVVPSSLDQLYEGVVAETGPGRAAVDATAGMVLRFGDAIAQAEYSSCCGGHTESASDAWGGPEVAYLDGVTCPYCTDSPHYRWSQDVSLAAIASALGTELEGQGQLLDVRLGPRDGSGRTSTVQLVSESASIVICGTDFRLGVGASVIPSLLIFEAGVRGSVLHLDGGGSGHGVGLCQWGARGLAAQGGSVAQIASFYFPATAIDRWTNVSPPRTSTSFRRA